MNVVDNISISVKNYHFIKTTHLSRFYTISVMRLVTTELTLSHLRMLDFTPSRLEFSFRNVLSSQRFSEILRINYFSNHSIIKFVVGRLP